jgi:hypothetical protein
LTADVFRVYDTPTSTHVSNPQASMTRIALTVVAALAISWLFAAAQPPGTATRKKDEPSRPAAEDPKPSAPKGMDGPPEFEVNFSDNSNVKVVVLDPSVAVSTRYGKLIVPVAELKRLELGFRYPEGIEAKVNAAVANLGSPAFREREEAEKELLGHKEYAVPALRRAVKGTDAEVTRRADDLLKRITAKLPEDRVSVKDDDTVETLFFTIRGRLETTTIRVKTRQFGETALKIDEVKTFRSLFAGSGTTDFTLDAAKYANQGWTAWLDTGIDVSTDAALQVTVTGQIDQWPQEPGRYMSGPAGTGATAPGGPPVGVRAPRGAPGPGAALPPGFPQPGAARYFSSGSVVGKVGADGEPFQIGVSFRAAKAASNGRLYLAIAPSNWGNASAGAYQVKVKVGD